jgi:lipoate-protein ligase A
MAFDTALFEKFQEGDQPLLRFYGWNYHTLTLGKIEARRLADKNLPWPHEIRPTGGRAVLHGPGDLCYSVLASTTDPMVGGTLLESYRKISGILSAALQTLGRDTNLSSAKHPALDAPHCFASPAHAELLLGGKKVAGGAQARKGNVFLQQGVILLSVDPGWERLAPPGTPIPMTGLNEDKALPPMTRDQLEKAVVKAFQVAGVVF